METDVRWHSVTTPADEALDMHAQSLLGPGAVSSGRLCPACGSDGHGRPWLRHEGRGLHASVARSGPHLVTVLADRPVGVDVEAAVIDVRPELVHAPGEVDDLARAWARKEAILKMRGTGLATPMVEVVLAAERWRDLPSPDGYVAALAAWE
ncbi:MAG: 4'-phosphopantetheinyl transferase superfamily protein [Nocardioides sp.]|nr:4'-phosphopantetheinyl transferase superfamily protein [Nocardioides sp.]